MQQTKNSIDLTQIPGEIKRTKTELLAVVSSFPQEKINTVPFAGSWTAGQVSEHLLKAVGTDLLYGKTKKADRDPAEKIETLEKIFLDFNTKLTSPDFILPSNRVQEKEDLLGKLESLWNRIDKAAGELDLDEICLDFEMPGMGTLTRLEWICFFICHTRRHIFQLTNIHRKLHAA